MPTGTRVVGRERSVSSSPRPVTPALPPEAVEGRGGDRAAWQVAGVGGILLILVACTGNYRSPLLGLLYLPVFFAAIALGARGSALTAAGLNLALLFLAAFAPAPLSFGAVLLQAVIFLVVAVGAGVFAERMLRAVRAANHRARRGEQRAAELEWLTDTVSMMESLLDLESMLSALLLRLGDVARCDWAAVYLRASDEPHLQLAQSLGLDPRRTRLRSLSPSDQAVFLNSDARCYRWTALRDGVVPPGPFAELDRDLQSLVALPLRGADETFGVLVLGARSPGAFNDRECERLTRLAAHVVYPIQRVRLQTMATTDALTGLNNRRAFFSRLKDEVERARRYPRPLSLIILDIDHFKRINDTLGHPAGDAALAFLGDLLPRLARATDYVARVGGEEIAVLCPETPGGESRVLAERIRRAVEDATIPVRADDGSEARIRMTVSLGIAALPDDADDAEALFQQADKALYRAKGSGRNRVAAAHAPDDEPFPALALPTVRRRR